MNHKASFPNQLIHENSPYLLQHAHNPVEWLPWNAAAFEKAKQENKLLLVSIGYSSCHWCHVMERESFEDTSTAEIMNKHFVCIKVDREERPDVDMIYMEAVQLMTGKGGWPLNCFVLPDGRPVYGGTYFTNTQWKNILSQLAAMYSENPEKFSTYSNELLHGIESMQKIENGRHDFTTEHLASMISAWKLKFDKENGGMNYVPKFPMPNNYLFLLRYAVLTDDKEVLQHLKHTLTTMAAGGLYDLIGGGFSRYSTDAQWKIPHFEKMLYDNAQLISLYSEAYRAFKIPLFKEVVEQCIAFVQKELAGKTLFYSALDADSEGEEGKYYTWTREELDAVDFDVSEIFSDKATAYNLLFDYFSIDEKERWEDVFILRRGMTDEMLCSKYNLSLAQLQKIANRFSMHLYALRNKRIKPMLDDKSLTSWNALMISALCDAGDALSNKDFISAAETHLQDLLHLAQSKEGKLFHAVKNDQPYISGFLEDYCFLMEACIKLYVSTFKEYWLTEADRWMQYVITHFSDEEGLFFYINSDEGEKLITRKMEIQDNVIPAGNSVMAHVLFLLGKYLDKEQYANRALAMLEHISPDMNSYPSAYSNWGLLALYHIFPLNEIVFTGTNCFENRNAWMQHYFPNCLVAGSDVASELSLLKDRLEKQSLIYICRNNTCQMPKGSMEEAVTEMKKLSRA